MRGSIYEIGRVVDAEAIDCGFTKRGTIIAAAATATSWSGGRQLLAIAHAARLDRRVPPGLAPLRCGRGYPAVRRRPKSYRLDLVSSTEFSNGTVGLQYRRHR
jgi:hypothetical protein